MNSSKLIFPSLLVSKRSKAYRTMFLSCHMSMSKAPSLAAAEATAVSADASLVAVRGGISSRPPATHGSGRSVRVQLSPPNPGEG
eukprot:1134702-Alexandrium_andersonii.AAC.1